MFLGTTTAPVRAYIFSALQGRTYERIFEPFAGNFTFTQVARKAVPGAHIISGDVGVYSALLGRGLHGDPVRFEVSDWLAEHFPPDPAWTDRERAAYVVFLSDVAKYALKMEKVEYARRMIAIYQGRQDQIVGRIVLKIEAAAAYSDEKGHLFRNKKPLSFSCNPLLRTMPRWLFSVKIVLSLDATPEVVHKSSRRTF